MVNEAFAKILHSLKYEEDCRSNSPDMTTVFYLWRKQLCRTNQGSNSLEGSFSNKDNVRAQSHLKENDNPNILKDDFPSRTDPSIFTSIAPELLNRLNGRS